MPTLTPILAAAVTKDSTAGEIVSYQSVGFIIVLCSLAALAVIITITGKFFQKPAAGQAAAPAKTSPAPAGQVAAAPAGNNDGGVPAHIAAVIAAAVAVEIGQSHQIVAVTQVGSNWSMEGRRRIFADKTYRRR